MTFVQKIARKAAPPLKRNAPRLYDFGIRLLSSELSRTLRHASTILRENRLLASVHPRFPVNMGQRCGLGALMTESMQALAYCDAHHLQPRLRFTNPLYSSVPGEDWLPRYFEVFGKLKPDAEEPVLRQDQYVAYSINLLRKFRPAISSLTLGDMHRLFTTSLGFRRDLLDEAEEFCSQNEIGERTIGVHYRGTDKRLEAGVVAWDDLGAQVEACLSAETKNIFVATDEPDFLRWMQDRFRTRQVVDLDCQEIYSGGLPAHLTGGNPEVKAREAIQTVLVLARCGLLVRTRSNLSAWAKILNPGLPVIVFGAMHDVGFPENLIQTDAKEFGIVRSTMPNPSTAQRLL